MFYIILYDIIYTVFLYFAIKCERNLKIRWFAEYQINFANICKA